MMIFDACLHTPSYAMVTKDHRQLSLTNDAGDNGENLEQLVEARLGLKGLVATTLDQDVVGYRSLDTEEIEAVVLFDPNIPVIVAHEKLTKINGK